MEQDYDARLDTGSQHSRGSIHHLYQDPAYLRQASMMSDNRGIMKVYQSNLPMKSSLRLFNKSLHSGNTSRDGTSSHNITQGQISNRSPISSNYGGGGNRAYNHMSNLRSPSNFSSYSGISGQSRRIPSRNESMMDDSRRHDSRLHSENTVDFFDKEHIFDDQRSQNSQFSSQGGGAAHMRPHQP